MTLLFEKNTRNPFPVVPSNMEQNLIEILSVTLNTPMTLFYV